MNKHQQEVDGHVQTIAKLQEENMALRDENGMLLKLVNTENRRGILGLANAVRRLLDDLCVEEKL